MEKTTDCGVRDISGSRPPAEDQFEARQILATNSHNAYPVSDPGGRLAGVIARARIPDDHNPPHLWPLLEATTVSMDATLDHVEASLVDAQLGIVVVVDSNMVPLGIFTLHDLLRCQLSLMENA